MKFYVRNQFEYGGITKHKDDIIEVNPDKINILRAANVLGAPVKETIIETAVIKPVENEMIEKPKVMTYKSMPKNAKRINLKVKK